LWRGNSQGTSKTANPNLALDASGNAFVVWEDLRLGQPAIPWANRYDATLEVWSGTAALKEAEPRELQGTKGPKVVATQNGDAIAVWTHEDKDERIWYAWANHYDAQTGSWGPARRLGGGVEAASARVAIDAQGNALAVWGSVSSDGRYANASTFSAADDLWSPIEVLSTETNSVSPKPRVAMTSDGHAIVVWQKVDGVYASYYIVP
jgi:hypothetical protein